MCTCSDFNSHHTSTRSEFFLICLEISRNYEIKLIQESALVEAVDGAEILFTSVLMVVGDLFFTIDQMFKCIAKFIQTSTEQHRW